MVQPPDVADVADIADSWHLYRNSSEMYRKCTRLYLALYQKNPKQPKQPEIPYFSVRVNRVSDDLKYDRTAHLVGCVSNNKRRRCVGEDCIFVGFPECMKCNVGLCIECFCSFHTK